MRPSSLALLTRLFSAAPFKPLYETIEHLMAVRPEIVLFEQEAVEDAPVGLRGDGGTDDKVIRRRTAYRVAGEFVSHHEAYVQTRRLDPKVKYELVCGRLPIAEIFANPRFKKGNFTSGDDTTLVGASRRGFELFGDESYAVRPYLWRHYSVEFDGEMSFLIAELLPIRQWARLWRATPQGTFTDRQDVDPPTDGKGRPARR